MSTPFPASRALKRLAVVAPSARALIKTRGELLRAIAARGDHVMVVAPSFTPEEQGKLSALGVERVAVTPSPPPSRFLRRPQARAALAALIKDWSPHVTLGFGAAVVDAAMAAHDARVPHIASLITEWPVAAIEDTRVLAKALAASRTVVCQNEEQARTLRASTMVEPGRPIAIVPGAGVDLERFAAAALPGHGLPSFLMLSRLERSRGVLDYCAAARLVRLRHPQARFALAGPAGSSASAVTGDEILAFAGVVDFLGDLDDVRPALAQCSVYVYPSHGEGMAASVLEAMATGRAIVATRVPGVRECVDDGVNGSLVAVSDVAGLVDALEAYVKWPDLVTAGGRASRAKAERLFDAREATRRMLAVLALDD